VTQTFPTQQVAQLAGPHPAGAQACVAGLHVWPKAAHATHA